MCVVACVCVFVCILFGMGGKPILSQQQELMELVSSCSCSACCTCSGTIILTCCGYHGHVLHAARVVVPLFVRFVAIMVGTITCTFCGYHGHVLHAARVVVPLLVHIVAIMVGTITCTFCGFVFYAF